MSTGKRNEWPTAECLLALIAGTALAWSVSASAEGTGAVEVIVQGQGTASVADLVSAAGGRVTRELGIIDAVAAELTASQLAVLAGADGVRRIWDSDMVEASKRTTPSTDGPSGTSSYPSLSTPTSSTPKGSPATA